MKFGDFCTHCGHFLGRDETSPRQCSDCHQFMYRNPTPVAVAVVPVLERPSSSKVGLLVVRRNLPPIGQLALPGGFMECGESWQQAVARELREETGISVAAETPEDITIFHVDTSLHNNILLMFGLTNPVRYGDIKFTPNSEVQEIKVLWEPEDLCFPTHTKIAKRFFSEYKPHNEED